MNFEKLFYVILSTILITVFILVTYIFPPYSMPSGVAAARKIYYVDNISESHKKVIDLFNNKYKGQIEVEAINLPFEKFSTNERKELLARYLRSKSDRIDIFSVDQIWVPRFAKWGMNFGKYIAAPEREQLLNEALKSCYWNDSLVAVPLYIDVGMMFYRKDLITSLGYNSEIQTKLRNSITWEEFIELNQTAGGSPFYVFQGDDYEGLICSFIEMVTADNSLSENGNIKLNTPEVKKAVQTLVDLVNRYKISPKEVLNFKENQSYDYFVKNNGLFLRAWPSFESAANKRYYNNPKVFDNLEKVPTPHFKGQKPVSVYGGWNLMISQYSNKIPEALKFINFLISDEAQKIMYEDGGYLPVNNSVYSDRAFMAKHPELMFYKKLLDQGVHRPFFENYTNVSDILSLYINKAMKQEISVDKALAEAEEKINSGSIILK